MSVTGNDSPAVRSFCRSITITWYPPGFNSTVPSAGTSMASTAFIPIMPPDMELPAPLPWSIPPISDPSSIFMVVLEPEPDTEVSWSSTDEAVPDGSSTFTSFVASAPPVIVM